MNWRIGSSPASLKSWPGNASITIGAVPDAEDAFQATFLALARKASVVCQSDAVAGWLHTVALRTALRACKNAAQRLKTNVDLAAFESSVDPYREPG